MGAFGADTSEAARTGLSAEGTAESGEASTLPTALFATTIAVPGCANWCASRPRYLRNFFCSNDLASLSRLLPYCASISARFCWLCDAYVCVISQGFQQLGVSIDLVLYLQDMHLMIMLESLCHQLHIRLLVVAHVCL